MLGCNFFPLKTQLVLFITEEHEFIFIGHAGWPRIAMASVELARFPLGELMFESCICS